MAKAGRQEEEASTKMTSLKKALAARKVEKRRAYHRRLMKFVEKKKKEAAKRREQAYQAILHCQEEWLNSLDADRRKLVEEGGLHCLWSQERPLSKEEQEEKEEEERLPTWEELERWGIEGERLGDKEGLNEEKQDSFSHPKVEMFGKKKRRRQRTYTWDEFEMRAEEQERIKRLGKKKTKTTNSSLLAFKLFKRMAKWMSSSM